MLHRRCIPTSAAVLAALGALACSGDSKTPLTAPTSEPGPETASAPAAIARVSGDHQEARALERLPEPFVVRVSDPAGDGVSGVNVSWHVLSGGGAVSARATRTNAMGRTAVFFDAPAEGDLVTVEARAPGVRGSPVTFTVEIVDGEPSCVDRERLPSCQ